ncbi:MULTISPECIES: hypothetical protein [Hyphobacterium]|uniref:Lipoprotein n=1 Tax=Hyphobacterium vulgare TaxID=1736751 RepID=A0ABV6ZZ41_9PROT
MFVRKILYFSLFALCACGEIERPVNDPPETDQSTTELSIQSMDPRAEQLEQLTVALNTPDSWSTDFSGGEAGWSAQRESLDDQRLSGLIGSVVQIDQIPLYEQTGIGDLYSRDRVHHLDGNVYSVRIRLRQTADPESGRARHVVGLFFLDENGGAVSGTFEVLNGDRNIYVNASEGWVEQTTRFRASAPGAVWVRAMVRLHQSLESSDVANATVQIDSVGFSVQFDPAP